MNRLKTTLKSPIFTFSPHTHTKKKTKLKFNAIYCCIYLVWNKKIFFKRLSTLHSSEIRSHMTIHKVQTTLFDRLIIRSPNSAPLAALLFQRTQKYPWPFSKCIRLRKLPLESVESSSKISDFRLGKLPFKVLNPLRTSVTLLTGRSSKLRSPTNRDV